MFIGRHAAGGRVPPISISVLDFLRDFDLFRATTNFDNSRAPERVRA